MTQPFASAARWLTRGAAGLFGVIVCAGPGLAQTTQLHKRFADWSAYRHEAPEQHFCFVMGQPKQTQPSGLQRGPARVYVTSWPKAGVKAEISVRIGYPFKPGAPAILAVGSDSFLLFTKDDRGFVESAADELRLLEALKKAERMSIQGQSERGTTTTDTYSLAGFAAAVQHLSQICP